MLVFDDAELVVLPTDNMYSSRELLERLYGRQNVLIWGDKDGTQDESDVNSVIERAIFDASREIDANLSAGTYVVPFISPIPAIVEHIATLRAGAILYTSRGAYTEHHDRMMKTQNTTFYSIVEDIRRGKMVLTQTKKVKSNAPFVSRN